MKSDPRKKNIFDSFPSSSKKDWIDVATNELNDPNPFEKLKISGQGVTVYPYYDVSDPINTPFQLSVSNDPYKSNRAWENLSIIRIHKPEISNQEALLALQSGADGILFSLHDNSFSETLLKNIQWQHCSLRFFAQQGQESFFLSLHEFALKQGLNKKEISGSIFWKFPANDFLKLISAFKEFKKFQSLGIILIEKESKQEMISNALAQAVHFIDSATALGIPVSQIVGQIAFSVPVGANFFLEIATLKTLRRLWYQIIHAYDSSIPSEVHIHAYSTTFTKSQLQPHANMIKSPTAALAAILGGCDSLSIEPEDYKNSTSTRIARNVSSVLLEESHLGLVADPTVGSYYIDNLSDQLAKSSWQLFQQQVVS